MRPRESAGPRHTIGSMTVPARDPLIRRMQGFGATIFGEMSALATRTGAINLGQGFPDTDGPDAVLAAARDAIGSGLNQYPPARGLPQLREAIRDHQRRFYDLSLDADRQVLVTVGATEAIAAAVLALCEPGDEVVTFEPYYDSYAATIALAGAVRRTSALRFPDYAIDEESLRAAFSSRTRLVLLNTPHNPTGKVFTRGELELIAQLAREHHAVVVTDEVYEHLTFDGACHVPMATLPGMFERTLTIGSGGKTFATTGWKIGWLTGPEHLVTACASVKQFVTYAGGGPFQLGIARGLGLPDEVFAALAGTLQHGRDILTAGLRDAGLTVGSAQGTYFVIADVAALGATDAVDFCWRMPELCGVVGVPVSVFCDDEDIARTLVRFAFCKKPEVLTEAAGRLARLGPGH